MSQTSHFYPNIANSIIRNYRYRMLVADTPKMFQNNQMQVACFSRAAQPDSGHSTKMAEF